MRRPLRRWIVLAAAPVLLLALPGAFYACLNYQPRFYRARTTMPPQRRQAEARQFVAQSLQLRNDIMNEPTWEAAFTDEEVNAWLAEDLVVHFADQIPPGVHEPRVAFEPDRVTLAFQLDQGPIRSLIWVVVRVDVPEPNVLSLAIEKIRAGMMPVSAQSLLGPITEHARQRGLDIHWDHDDGLPRALVRYQADQRRADIVLEQFRVLNGQVRLSGRSERHREGIARLSLPGRKMLQSAFPNRAVQASAPPVTLLRSSTTPSSTAPESRTRTRSSLQDRTM
jgi:hypothetical protein